MSFTYIAVAGFAVSAYGAYTAGQDALKQADYNASIEERNAEQIRAGAAREGKIIKENAILNEYRQRKRMDITTGQQIGGYAARGVDVTTGSPLDVVADSIANAELEIAIGQWNAQNEIDVNTYNAEVAAQGRESSASMRRRIGRDTARASTYQAAGTLLSSGKILSSGKTRIGNKSQTIGGGRTEVHTGGGYRTTIKY